MKKHELQSLLRKLQSECENALDIAKTAEKSRQSLTGSSRYADRFHSVVVLITGSEKQIRPHLAGLHVSSEEISRFESAVGLLRSTSGKSRERQHAMRDLRLVCESTLLPALDNLQASPIPTTEQVLPFDVVRATRGYFEEIVIQINGCYEHQWYDGCSVLIRKLAEMLIIAVFQKKGVSNEIKGSDGNFFMLSKLVEEIEKKIDWDLGRETKPCLKEMKTLGDRSAHNRHYLAKKADVDSIISRLRVAVQELLVHADLAKSTK